MLQGIDYAVALILSFIICGLLVPVLMFIAKRFGIVDDPQKVKDPTHRVKKIHKKIIPLLGGVAIFGAMIITVGIFYFLGESFSYALQPKHLLGVLIGGLILMIGGFLDDKYDLKPKYQIIFPILAICTVIACGIGINWLKNPFSSGTIWLDQAQFTLFRIDGLPYKVTILADLFTLLWLLGMTYTTKLMDGLDGLVSGITVIGGIFIFISSLIKDFAQPDIALLAIILVGCYLAFLLFNFNPAKIFLGEGGALFSGFILGVLSIISGSKVGVTLILMGLPILDVLWTIIRRLMEGKNPFRTADRKHLHHRLLDAGFSMKKAVLILYAVTLIFGAAAIFLQNLNYGLAVVGVLVILAFFLLSAYLYKIKKEKARASLD